MESLLRFELRKLFRSKSFYICLGILIVLEALSVFIIKSMSGLVSGVTGLDGVPAPDLTTQLFATLPGGNVTLLLSILIPIFLCADYSTGAIKNVFSKGFSKTSIFFSKLIACLITAFLFIAASLMTCLATGAILLNSGEALQVEQILILLLQVLLVLAIICTYVFISVLIRKTGGSIALCIIAPSILGTIMTLLDFLLETDKYRFSYILPANCLTALNNVDAESHVMIISLICALGYIALTTIGSCLIMHNSEV